MPSYNGFSEKQKAVIIFTRSDIKHWIGEELTNDLMILKEKDLIVWPIRQEIMDSVFALKFDSKYSDEMKSHYARKLSYNICLALDKPKEKYV